MQSCSGWPDCECLNQLTLMELCRLPMLEQQVLQEQLVLKLQVLVEP